MKAPFSTFEMHLKTRNLTAASEAVTPLLRCISKVVERPSLNECRAHFCDASQNLTPASEELICSATFEMRLKSARPSKSRRARSKERTRDARSIPIFPSHPGSMRTCSFLKGASPDRADAIQMRDGFAQDIAMK